MSPGMHGVMVLTPYSKPPRQAVQSDVSRLLLEDLSLCYHYSFTERESRPDVVRVSDLDSMCFRVILAPVCSYRCAASPCASCLGTSGTQTLP